MLEFNKQGDSITTTNIESFESLVGIELPQDYKVHMLNYNGGRIPYTKICSFDFKNENYELGGFKKLEDVKSFYQLKKSVLYPNYISIGDIEGGYLAMGYKTENYGEIYVYFSDEEPQKVASSFTEFLESMEIVDEE